MARTFHELLPFGIIRVVFKIWHEMSFPFFLYLNDNMDSSSDESINLIF